VNPSGRASGGASPSLLLARRQKYPFLIRSERIRSRLLDASERRLAVKGRRLDRVLLELPVPREDQPRRARPVERRAGAGG
jgi:hypothetical protein